MSDISDRLLNDLVDAVKEILRKEQSDRLRDVYLIGDIDKDSARSVIERLRELANDGRRPINLYINSAGGNVTDGLALHDTISHIVSMGIEVTVIVQGMAYSMGSVVAAGGQPGPTARLPAFLDHDSRAREVGGLAVNDRGRATPRSVETDAEPDLPAFWRIDRASLCARSSGTRSATTSIWMRKRRRTTGSSTRCSAASSVPPLRWTPNRVRNCTRSNGPHRQQSRRRRRPRPPINRETAHSRTDP